MAEITSKSSYNFTPGYNTCNVVRKSFVAGDAEASGHLENTNMFNPRTISMDLPHTERSRGADPPPGPVLGERAGRVRRPRLTPRGSGRWSEGAELDRARELPCLLADGCGDEEQSGKAEVMLRPIRLANPKRNAKVGESSFRLTKEAIITSRVMINKVTNKTIRGRTFRYLSSDDIMMIPRTLTIHPGARSQGQDLQNKHSGLKLTQQTQEASN